MQLKKAEWCEPGAGTFLPSYSKNTATDRNEQSEMGTELVCKTRHILGDATCPSVSVRVCPCLSVSVRVRPCPSVAVQSTKCILSWTAKLTWQENHNILHLFIIYETIYCIYRQKQPKIKRPETLKYVQKSKKMMQKNEIKSQKIAISSKEIRAIMYNTHH